MISCSARFQMGPVGETQVTPTSSLSLSHGQLTAVTALPGPNLNLQWNMSWSFYWSISAMRGPPISMTGFDSFRPSERLSSESGKSQHARVSAAGILRVRFVRSYGCRCWDPGHQQDVVYIRQHTDAYEIVNYIHYLQVHTDYIIICHILAQKE